MKQLYIATLSCSNSLLPTITFSKMKSPNSCDNRYSVPGAGIRAGKLQYLNAQREFLKIYRILFHLFKSYAVLTNQLLQWTQRRTRARMSILKKVIYSNLLSPFRKLLSYRRCGRFQRCRNTTTLPWLVEYVKHKYMKRYVLILCYQQQEEHGAPRSALGMSRGGRPNPRWPQERYKN